MYIHLPSLQYLFHKVMVESVSYCRQVSIPVGQNRYAMPDNPQFHLKTSGVVHFLIYRVTMILSFGKRQVVSLQFKELMLLF